MQGARDRPPDRLVGPCFYLSCSPQPADGHRAEGVQQNGLADTAQAGEHHAALWPATSDPLEHHLKLGNLASAARQLGRALPSAGSVRIAYRVHGIGLYGAI